MVGFEFASIASDTGMVCATSCWHGLNATWPHWLLLDNQYLRSDHDGKRENRNPVLFASAQEMPYRALCSLNTSTTFENCSRMRSNVFQSSKSASDSCVIK